MLDLNLLYKLMASFGAGAPQVRPGACLNAFHGLMHCQACADACPAVAIRVAGAQVQLAPDLCVRCGVCLAVCPTGAFDAPGQAQEDHKLLAAAASASAQTLELTCPANQQPDQTAAPVAVVLQTGRCLAALSLAELLDLAAPRQHPLWLNDSNCAACPLEKVQPLIAAQAAQANRLLAAWRRSGQVLTRSGRRDIAPAAHRVDLYSLGHVSYSRRQFLTLLRRTTTHLALTVAADALAPIELAGPLAQGPEMSYQRRHLLAALARLGPAAAGEISLDDLPWAVVEVSAACSACEQCARCCPTAAIRFSVETLTGDDAPMPAPSHFRLQFIAADCIGCGICQAVCPEDAISLQASVDPARLNRRELTPLYGDALGPCAVCGTPTNVSLRSKCYMCNMSLSQKRQRMRS